MDQPRRLNYGNAGAPFIDARRDMALLETGRRDLTRPLRIRERAIGVGESITVAGYGAGMHSSGEGFVLSIDSTAEFSVKSALQPDDSGSPVLDQDGVVAGMVMAKPQNAQTTVYDSERADASVASWTEAGQLTRNLAVIEGKFRIRV